MTVHKNNLLPEPHKEINLTTFMLNTLLYHTSWEEREHRSVQLDDEGALWSTTILWYDDKTVGYAIANLYTNVENTAYRGDIFRKDGTWSRQYGHLARYFKIGCTHSYKELSRDACKDLGIHHFGAMWHVEQCQNCEFIRAYDSSG